MPTKLSRFNDGVLSIYRDKGVKTDFSARKNVQTLDDMDFIVKLNYEESSKRQQDMEFAEQLGFSLSLKVKTRWVPQVTSKMKVAINGYLYDIRYMDKSGREMYLYLEGVRELA